MSQGWPIPTRGEFASQGIEGSRVIPEVADIEHGLGVWEVQGSEISIDTGFWRPEIRDPSRCTYTSPNLARFLAVGLRIDHKFMGGPTITTIRRTCFSLIYLATASIFRASRTDGGVFSSTKVEGSLPMMPRGRPNLGFGC